MKNFYELVNELYSEDGIPVQDRRMVNDEQCLLLLENPGFIISPTKLDLEGRFAGEYLVSGRSFSPSNSVKFELPRGWRHMDPDSVSEQAVPLEYVSGENELERNFLDNHLPDISAAKLHPDLIEEDEVEERTITASVDYFLYYPLRSGLGIFIDYIPLPYYTSEINGIFRTYAKKTISDSEPARLHISTKDRTGIFDGEYYFLCEDEAPCLDFVYLPELNQDLKVEEIVAEQPSSVLSPPVLPLRDYDQDLVDLVHVLNTRMNLRDAGLLYPLENMARMSESDTDISRGNPM